MFCQYELLPGWTPFILQLRRIESFNFVRVLPWWVFPQKKRWFPSKTSILRPCFNANDVPFPARFWWCWGLNFETRTTNAQKVTRAVELRQLHRHFFWDPHSKPLPSWSPPNSVVPGSLVESHIGSQNPNLKIWHYMVPNDVRNTPGHVLTCFGVISDGKTTFFDEMRILNFESIWSIS